MFRLIFVFTALLVSLSHLQAKEIKIVGFAGNNSSTSGELLVMLEEVVKANSEKYKIVSIKDGIGFRKESVHLFPVNPSDLIEPYTSERVLDVKCSVGSPQELPD